MKKIGPVLVVEFRKKCQKQILKIKTNYIVCFSRGFRSHKQVLQSLIWIMNNGISSATGRTAYQVSGCVCFASSLATVVGYRIYVLSGSQIGNVRSQVYM
jgi:hypothetical protein